MEKNLVALNEKYIRDTIAGEFVVIEKVLLCHLTKIVVQKISNSSVFPVKAYTTTRVLKHLYEKRTAEDYDFFLQHANSILERPDRLYENKNAKRGDVLFFKSMYDYGHICSVEVQRDALFLITCFRFHETKRQKNYLKNYNLLWSWEDGRPPS